VKNRILPRHTAVALIILAISVLLFLLSLFFSPVADFLNYTVAGLWRGIVTAVFSLVPFSVAEIFLFGLPIILILFIVLSVRLSRDGKRFRRLLLGTLTFASVLLSQFLVTVAIGYRTTPMHERLGLSDADPTEETLEATAGWLIGEAAALADRLERDDKGALILPYSDKELSDALMQAYDDVNDEHRLTPYCFSRIKPVAASTVMSKAHFLGMWTYVTGEANINTEIPDYTFPYTAAHEMAHQRGVAREDEANFVAFLVLVAAEDPLLRYCGYVGLFEYVYDALYAVSADRAKKVAALIPSSVYADFRAYSAYYAKYAESTFADVTGTLNDAYLKLQGTGGTVNYSEVVRLAVAFHGKEAATD
jgi:hypothetical protein